VPQSISEQPALHFVSFSNGEYHVLLAGRTPGAKSKHIASYKTESEANTVRDRLNLTTTAVEEEPVPDDLMKLVEMLA
jgi:hypothetical protein